MKARKKWQGEFRHSAKLVTLVLLLTTIYTSIFFLQKQEFINADLGRHITNGRILLSGDKGVLYTNYYAYTHPDYPAINHHWLTGIIFHFVHSLGGFPALSLLAYIIYTITIGLAVYVPQKSTMYAKLTVLILMLPLIATRNQVRPEMFSYLGLVLYMVLLERYRLTSYRTYLYAIPLYAVFWANAHIYFIFGIFVILMYLLETFKYKDTEQSKTLSYLLAATLLASCLNPFGLELLKEPFRVMQDYGYLVSENQSVFEHLKYFFAPSYYHFLAIITAFVLTQKTFSSKIGYRGITQIGIPTTFAILGILMVRNIVMFGYAVLIIGPLVLSRLTKAVQTRVASIALMIAIVLGLVSKPGYYVPEIKYLGLGLRDGALAAGEFLRKADIKGPIFNNYNIGGYLIYYLFPEEKVFVDNRPKEYPSSFFTDTYKPLHYDHTTWASAEQTYGFQTIIYDYHDLAARDGVFLSRIEADPTWEQVYKDPYGVIIFSKVASKG